MSGRLSFTSMHFISDNLQGGRLREGTTEREDSDRRLRVALKSPLTDNKNHFSRKGIVPYTATTWWWMARAKRKESTSLFKPKSVAQACFVDQQTSEPAVAAADSDERARGGQSGHRMGTRRPKQDRDHSGDAYQREQATEAESEATVHQLQGTVHQLLGQVTQSEAKVRELEEDKKRLSYHIYQTKWRPPGRLMSLSM